jgi:hypothetical protein
MPLSKNDGICFASEGALMAKRETNKERREREQERGRIFEIARQIAGAIRTRRHVLSLSAREKKTFEYIEKVFDHYGWARLVGGEWVESESLEDIAQGLRLAAHMLEEKPMDGRSLSGHDSKIREAFLTVSRRLWRSRSRPGKLFYEDAISRITILPQPTFSEFLEIYREQNPGVKIEDRALRRSLRRLGFITRPDVRGRPKEK